MSSAWQPHRCPDCGYPLTGLPLRHRCPECGFAYAGEVFVLDQQHRSVLGFLGCVLVTLWVVAVLIMGDFGSELGQSAFAGLLAILAAFAWYRWLRFSPLPYVILNDSELICRGTDRKPVRIERSRVAFTEYSLVGRIITLCGPDGRRVAEIPLTGARDSLYAGRICAMLNERLEGTVRVEQRVGEADPIGDEDDPRG